MDDDELLALLQGKPTAPSTTMSDGDLLASLEGAPPAQQASAQVVQNPAPEAAPPSFFDKTLNVIKGLPQAGLDLIDTPYNLESLARMGAEKAGPALTSLYQKRPFSSPYANALVSGAASYLTEGETTSPKPSNLFPDQWKEALAGETVTREEAPLSSALRKGVEWGAGGIGNKIRGASVIPDVLSAAGATAGDYLGSELTGGLVGTLLGTRKGKVPGQSKGERRALEYIESTMDETQSAQVLEDARSAVARGDRGTLGDVTGSQTMADVEAGVASADATFGRAASDVEMARQAQVAEQLRAPFGDASPQGSIDTAVDQTQSLETAIEQAGQGEVARINAEDMAKQQILQQPVQQATQVAEQAAESARVADVAATESALPLSTNKRPAQASTELAEELNKAELNFKESVEQPAWDAFDNGPPVETLPLKESISEVYSALTKEARDQVTKKYGSLFTSLRKGGDEIAPADLQEVLREMRQTLENARANNTFNAAERNLSSIVDELDKAAELSNPRYRKAKAATTEKYERFYPGKNKRARQSNTAGDERLAGTLGFADEAGAETARLLAAARTPELIPRVIDQLKAYAKRGNGVDEAFIAKYGDVIESLPPEVQAQFMQAAESASALPLATKRAEQTATDATKAQTQANTAAQKSTRESIIAKENINKQSEALKKSVNKQIVGEYAKDGPKALKRILKSTETNNSLKSLYDSMKEAGKGEEFRAAVREQMMDSIYSTNNKTGRRVLKATDKNFNQMKKNAVDAGVLTEAEANVLDVALAKEAGTLAQRSDAVGLHMLQDGQEAKNLQASIASALVMTGIPGNQSLLVGGALRRMFKKIMSNDRAKPEAVAALENFILNPNEYVAAASQSKTAQEATSKILTKLVGASQAAALMNEEE